MTDSEQILIKQLIESNKNSALIANETNQSVKELTESVNKLITAEEVRIEKDKSYESRLEKLETFYDNNRDSIARTKKSQDVFDKSKASIITVVVLAILSVLGFNLKR